jgi:hypothetical protein
MFTQTGHSTEKVAYILSNAEHELFPENRLNRFSNSLPSGFLSQGNQWGMAVESFGIFNKFRNVNFLPGNFPDFVFLDRTVNFFTQKYFEELVGTKLLNHNLVFKCEMQKYTEKKLQNALKRVSYRFKDVKFELEDNKFTLTVTSPKEMSIYMSKKFLSSIIDINAPYQFAGDLLSLAQDDETRELVGRKLNLSGEQGKQFLKGFNNEWMHQKQINVAGHTYIGFPFFSKRMAPYSADIRQYTFDVIQTFKDPAPKIIKIVCNQIQHVISCDTYSKEVLVYAPHFVKGSHYQIQEVLKPEFYPFQHSDLRKVTFALLNENNTLLPFLSGFPSVIKLHFKKLHFIPGVIGNMSKVHFRIDSGHTDMYPNNINASFKVNLPKPLDARGTATKIALNSITFPNEFSIFKFMSRANSTVCISQNFDDSSDDISIDVLIPASINSLKDFIAFFNVKGLETNVVVSQDEENHLHFSTMFLTNRKPLSIDIKVTPDLAFLLGITGHADEHLFQKLEDKGVTSNEIVFQIKPDIEFVCANSVNIELVTPSYLIVYANFIENNVVGGEYSRILKFVPVNRRHLEKNEGYETVEFLKEEYFELTHDIISTMHIVIKIHNGEPAPFINPNHKVFCNFVLKNE